ncbi:MAG: septal ring lytic transglycosylase RlpA family protein [Candidatus Pacebacteria bacterium]|nr:septal ring lytic transglycosylase RlpA family protein [Candidatus Paceibacterota bacterium]
MLLLAVIVFFTIVTTTLIRPASASPSLFHTVQHAVWHRGNASWYGPRFFNHRRKDGTRYLKNEIFVAHRTYPIGTVLRVVNLKNRRAVEVVVRDRGPYRDKHKPEQVTCQLDLSAKAAAMLGMMEDGIVPVAYQVIRR